MRASPYDIVAYRPATISALISASTRRMYSVRRYFFGIGTVAVPVARSFGQMMIRFPSGVFCVMT